MAVSELVHVWNKIPMSYRELLAPVTHIIRCIYIGDQ